jgi:glycosyltransferase involved in cell wall biosynthesis/predicted TPR repeat methyltransferase
VSTGIEDVHDVDDGFAVLDDDAEHGAVAYPVSDPDDSRIARLEGDVDELRARLEEALEALERRGEDIERGMRERKALRIMLQQLEREVHDLERQVASRGRLRAWLGGASRSLRVCGTAVGSRRGLSQLASWIARRQFRNFATMARLSAADVDWDGYLRRYGDIGRARVHPLLHYVEHGGAEGRQLTLRSVSRGTPLAPVAAGSPPRVDNARTANERRRLEETLERRGIRAFRSGYYGQAASCFEALIAANSERPAPWLWLGRARFKLGDSEAAADSLRQALSLRPDWLAARLELADVLIKLQKRADARELLESALEESWDDPATLRRLANRFRFLRDYPSAMLASRRLLELKSSDEEGVYTLAVATWAAGSPQRAVQIVERAAADGPGATRAAVRLFLEFSDPEGAWRVLDSVPGELVNQTLLIRTARLLRRSGRLAHAASAYRKALDRDPENEGLQREHDLTTGEVRVLSGEWRPQVRDLAPSEPTPGLVLHVVGKSVPHVQSGYTVRTRYLTAAQRALGLVPHVVTQLGFPLDAGVLDPASFEIVDDSAHHRLLPAAGVPPRLDLRLDANVEALAALVGRLRPAVLHSASDFINPAMANAVARAARIPSVYEVRGFWEETWRSKQDGDDSHDRDAYRWRQERELECMLAADAVVTLGDGMKQALVERGVPAEKITVIRNGVDAELFAGATRDRALLEELGVGDADITLGYISSLTAYEGVRFLLEATARLLQDGRRVHTLVVGDGDAREELEALAEQLRIADRVHFLGRVPHAAIARYYGSIDIFVIPRTADRVSQLVTPLKPFEAMAAARPLVVSGVPALTEIVQDGVTGRVFRPEDPADLARVVEQLLNDPIERTRLGAAARDWVREEATWDANGLRYLDLYRSLGAHLSST